ncbi:MAG TPA: hypothetical protein VMC42_08075 [Methanoregulaceae archaeon]|nr:hypothetical protein [Methanoregulaceae archaeon]
MDGKKIIISWIAGAVLLFITMVIFSFVSMWIAPYSIYSIGGMRQATDPVTILYFAYPLVFSFTAACSYSLVRTALPGDYIRKGLVFGCILILLVLVNNVFVIFSSMVYPPGFFIELILNGLISYPLLGVLFAKIWDLQQL